MGRGLGRTSCPKWRGLSISVSCSQVGSKIEQEIDCSGDCSDIDAIYWSMMVKAES